MTAAIGWMEASTGGLRRRRVSARARLVRAGLWGCAGIVGILASAAAVVGPVPPGSPAAAPLAPDRVAEPVWVELAHPLRLFTLSGSPFAKLPLSYEARHRPDGTARRDLLTFGSFAAAADFLRVAIERGGPAPDESGDLVVTAARLAAGSGIAVVRAGLPEALPTRFGPFAVLLLRLRAGSLERSCLGFQLQRWPMVAVAGFACGADARAPAMTELACALDNLDLATPAVGAELRTVFAAADQRARPVCGTAAPPAAG